MSQQKRLKTIRLILRVFSIAIVGLMPRITFALPDPPLTEGQRAIRQMTQRYGELKYMNQVDAAADCKSRGARLPSIRELAELTKPYGGRVLGPEKKCTSFLDLCSEQHVRNEDGAEDIFVFDYSNLSLPEIGPFDIWSSSTEIQSPPNDGLVLSLDVGMILGRHHEQERTWYFCVADPVILPDNSGSRAQ